ncbi:MAG: penicillin-binding protein [Crocinitomicaceae bacterium]|nr:transpeptidase family protein [Crocinitomicaceae bacterium]
MEAKKEIVIKSYVMYVIVALVMLVVIVRVINIQYGDVVPDAPMAADSSGIMTTKVDSVAPMRGRILASDGSDLVTSVPLYDLHIDMTVIREGLFKEVDSLAINLANVFPDKTRNEWEAYLRKGKSDKSRYLLIERNVKYTVLKEVEKFPILRESQYKGGFIVEQHYERQKPNGILASRTLGYKREGIKPIGIEGGFDQYLVGEYGLRTKQWVNGSWKPVSADNLEDPVPGFDVVTSLDIDIQEVAENELRNQLESQNAVSGSVVLMEVETGFVKAIANLTKGEDGGYYETFNHAIGTKTDPGSTFKLASLMALLEDGKVDITDEVGAYGEYHFYNHTTYDSHEGGYGKISIQRAFEVSSNVFSKIVNDAYFEDAQKYVDRIKSFGLGDTLGLDISGEPFPVIKNRGENGWSGITLPQMAIGYEVELTPLQILAFYNAVANDGEKVKPQFVSEIRRGNETVLKFEKEVINEKICSDATLEKVKICLEGVVKNGTGQILKSANFDIAGKTGTAKIVDVEAGTYGNQYQASFVGYFPADNPKYSCIVTIAGPTRQIYGAQVSGTVFTAIADKVYSSSMQYHENYNLTHNPIRTTPRIKSGSAAETQVVLDKMNLNYSNQSQGGQWISVSTEDNRISLQQRNLKAKKVPNVKGMPLNDAVYLLENGGLRVQVIGHGQVVKQSIEPGAELVKGTLITLELR